jgi:sulfur carrier protein
MTGASVIRVNGRSEPLAAANIAALLAEKDIAADARGVAIAVNGAVVPRADWATTPIKAGDDIEIVHARQGG